MCYDPLDDGSEVAVTPCAHRFHARCLPPHLVSLCPLCRTSLRPQEGASASQPLQAAALDVQREHRVQQALQYRRPEPPWLGSSAWTDCPTQRVWSEVERRRM